MIHVWELEPNQYEYQIFLILSDSSYEDIINILNEKHNFNIENKSSFSMPCTVIDENTNKIAIILNDFNKSIYDYKVLSHEIFHIITYIADNRNININSHTSECWAYFMSFYIELCLQCLNELC